MFRQQREKDKEEEVENDRRRVFNRVWKRFYGTFYTLKTVYDLFNEKRMEEIRRVRMLYCANKIKRGFYRRCARYGPDIETRHLNQERYAYNSTMIFLKEPLEKRAKYILASFLTSSSDKFSVFTSFLTFSKAADKLTQFYKKRLQVRSIYEYLLSKQWDAMYVNITQNNLLGKTKPKKLAKLMKKIYSVTNDTKLRVLKLYFDHCTLKFRLWWEAHRRGRS